MGEFSTEQSQISAVEKKAGKLDDQGKKTHETLEAELKAKHDVFFKQVDDTQKIFKEADALKDPVAINEIAKDKQDIKDMLLKAATSGETLLIDKTSDFTTIRQCADRVSKLTSTVKTNVDFFKDMDQANSSLGFAKEWLQKAQKFEGNGEKPQGWQKDYVLFLDSGMTSIGGVSALLKNHAGVSSAELKGVYDKIKKEADATMLLLTESRLKFLDNFPDSVNTYIDDEGKEREINVDQKSTILKIRAIRSGGTILPIQNPVDGYNTMLSLIPNAKEFIEKAGKETDEKQKQSYLDTAKDSLTRAKTSALTISSELATIGDEEARKLPEAFWNLYYTMKVNSASAFADASGELTKLERGNSNLDGKAAVESAEKEYDDGDESPKKSYEKAQKLRDDIMNAKELDLHSPLLGPVVEKATSKLCVLKGKLSAVDRAGLPREYQTRFDAIRATVDSNLQEIVQVQVLIKNNKLTEDINQKNDMNKDGKEYFRMVRKEINGQMVVVVEQTEEFKKLPPDQQQIFLAQYAAVPVGITLDLTRKMELKEDKDWNDGMAKFESGDWQGAKPLLLAYWNKFLNNPEKAVQTAATKSLLQAIVKIEFAQAKENFQIMDNVQSDRGDIAGVTRQALGVSVALGWDRMDAAERIVNSKDCPLTFVQLWDKVRKMPHGEDLVSEGISFMNPEVQQRMLSEPDPEKRRANILKLARAAKEAGMTPFAKKYFEMYFAGEIANKKKTVTRDQAEAAFNAKPDAAEQIKTGIKTAHDQARTHFITERNRRLNLNGRWPSDKDIADEKVDLEKWEANYQANAGDIEKRVRDGVIDDIWMKNVKKALNDDYKNAKVVNVDDGSLVKDAPVNVWNEAYGGHFGVAENITDSAIVFTSDDIRNTAAKIAVGILYLEIAAAAGVITGGAASAAILGGAAEVGAGTLFASQAVGFVVEGAVMHTVSVGLNEGAEGFKDGSKFMKGLVTTYATLGIMKGTGAILGKMGQRGATSLAEGAGEFSTPFYKGVAEGAWSLGKGAGKLVGKSVLDSTLMTGITWGSEKILNGKSMTGDELVRTFGENMVTFMVMGATHKAAEAGKGEMAEAGKGGKEGKVIRDAIRDAMDAKTEAEAARKKADQAKKAGAPDAEKLELEAKRLEGIAKTKDSTVGTLLETERALRLSEMQKKVDEMKKELEKKDLPPEVRKRLEFLVEQFEKTKADGTDLAQAERALFEEHRWVEVPDPNNPDKKIKIDLIGEYNSKNFAYSKEMVDLMNNHERLMKEGPKIIKHGGDEIVILHAGPDGKVQMFFGDIGNMGPTNEFALKLKGNDANMVDLYLRDFASIVKARFKPGQPIEGNALLQEIKNNLSKKYFGIESEAEFNKMRDQWGLDGTWQDYQINMGNARILAGFRSSSRSLQKEFAATVGDRPADAVRDNAEFSAFIEKKIQGLDTGTPPLTEILKKNLQGLQDSGALADLFPKGAEFNGDKSMNPDKLQKILSKSSRTAEENMMLYFALQRVNPEKIGQLSGVDGSSAQVVRDRFGKIRQPASDATLMDFQMAGIEVPKFEGRQFTTGDMKFFLDKVLEDGLHEAKKQKDKTDIYQSENPFDKDGNIRADHPHAKELREAHDKAKQDKKADTIAETQRLIREAQQKLDTITTRIRTLLDKKVLTEADSRALAELKRQYDALVEKINSEKYKDAETGADRPGKFAQDIEFWMRDRHGKPIEKQYQMYREFVLDMHNTGAINGQKGYAATDAAMRTIAQFMMARFPGASTIIRTGGGSFKLVFLDSRLVPQVNGQPIDMVQHQAMIQAVLPELNIQVQKAIAADSKTMVDGTVRDATESFRKRKGDGKYVGEVVLTGSESILHDDFVTSSDQLTSPRTLYKIVDARKMPNKAPLQGPLPKPAPPAEDYPIAAE